MLEERAVSTTHIANAFRLLIERPVENLHDDFVHFFEIRTVSAAAAPNVHATIDKQFGAGLVNPGDARIPEKKRIDNIEQRKIRHGYAVRCCNLRRIESA